MYLTFPNQAAARNDAEQRARSLDMFITENWSGEYLQLIHNNSESLIACHPTSDPAAWQQLANMLRAMVAWCEVKNVPPKYGEDDGDGI